ncbi:MAG: glycosyltransferase family 2 protein [Elusimicrobiota bacterium]
MSKVSIIIVNYNGKDYLKGCIESVLKQEYDDFNVIIVDNASTDGSVEFIKAHFPQVQIIQLDNNYGFTGGNNAGIKKAMEDVNIKYVALLNNDAIVDKNWLKELVVVAESEEKIGICQPKILSLENPKIIDAVGMGIKRDGLVYHIGWGEEDIGQYKNSFEIFGATAASVLYKIKMLKEIGLFDEDFFAYYEDVDISIRARIYGWKAVYVPEAVAYHKGAGTSKKNSPFTFFYMARNYNYCIIKNLPVDMIFYGLFKRFQSVLYAIFKIIIFLKSKDFEKARLNFFYVKGNIMALGKLFKMIRKRKKIFSERVISNEELKKWFV